MARPASLAFRFFLALRIQMTVAAIAPVIVGIVIFLIPGVRCWMSSRDVARLESETLQVEQEVKSREAAIIQLNTVKTSELVRAAETLKDLEHRLN